MLAVVVEGGLVIGIVTDDERLKGTKVMVIDYDVEGCEESEITKVPQGADLPVSDDSSDAWARLTTITQAEINLAVVAASIEARDAQ